jgi:hypothetical protein
MAGGSRHAWGPDASDTRQETEVRMDELNSLDGIDREKW